MKVNIPLVSNQNDGFGIMAKEIGASLRSFDHEVINDLALNDTSDLILNFAHPHQFRYADSTPVIGYMPWESTGARDGWRKHLSLVDDVWVTSPWLRDVVRDWGYDPYVYEHGLNPKFTRKSRIGPGKIRFLHVGMEAYRKGAFEAIRSFRQAFGNRDDVELVVKTKASSMPHMPYPNVTIIDENLDFDDMIALYHSCDVFLFPSYGEGFGLPARDAAATGMPVVTTSGFAPYESMLHPDLRIKSELIDSPWPVVHPGKMYKPNIDHTVDILRRVVDDFNIYADHAYRQSSLLHQTYNWEYRTGLALKRVQDKFGIDVS